MVNQDISLRKAKKKSPYWRNWFSAASIINLTYHRRVMGRNDLNLWFRLPHTPSIFGGCWPLPWADAEEKSNFPLARVFISAAGNNIFLLYFSSARYFSLQVSTRVSTISSNIHSGLTRLTQNEIFNLSTLSPSATLREGKIQISDTPRGRKNAKNFCVWCVVADCRPNVLSFQVKKLLFLLSVKIFSQTFFPTKRKFSFSVFFCFLYVFSTKQMLCFTSRVPQTQPVVVCPSLLSQKYIILAESKNDEQK